MKRFFVFAIFYLLIWSSVYAQGQIHRWDWYQEADSSNYQVVHDIAIDSARNCVYAVGGFEDDLSSNFGGVSARGGKDGFVAKFNLQGNLIWSFGIGGPGSEDEEVLSIDVDPTDGSIYIGGYAGNHYINFRGTGSGSGGTSVAQVWGGTDAFIAAYRGDGRLKWAQRDGSTSDDVCNDVVVDPSSNGVAYTGSFISVMELNTENLNMGDSDGDEHLFIAKRKKSNGDGIWRGYSRSQGGDFQRGIGLTRDANYLYLLGEYNGDATNGLRLVIEEITGNYPIIGGTVNIYGGRYTSSLLIDPSMSTQSIFYARVKDSDGEIEASNSWLYNIYSDGTDYAGDIAYRSNNLFISGSVGNNAFFKGLSNNPNIVGNECFVSKHSVSSGDAINKVDEPNLTASFAIMNTISFNSNYVIVGGGTDGTIRFDGNANNDLVPPNGRDEGFVVFYDQNLNFVERQKVSGNGTNEVNAVSGWRKHAFVGGAFGGTANLDDDGTMTGQDDESGFVSLLKHRDCTPQFGYGMDSVCQESPVLTVSYNDPVGVFSQIGNGLTLDSQTGEIDPFSSVGNSNNQIVYTTFIGCSDTVALHIEGSTSPSFNNPPINDTVYTDNGVCGTNYAYPSLEAVPDCGEDTIFQIDGSNLTSGSFFQMGSTLQSWVVADYYNPNDTANFIITVVDNIEPEISFSDDTVYFYADANSCEAIVDVESLLVFTDNCNIDTVLQVGDLTYLNGTSFSVRDAAYKLTYKVLDASNNSDSASIIVYVRDTINPVINNCIATDTTVYLTANECEKEMLFSNISATDACGIDNTSWVPQSTMFSVGTTAVTYTATDVNQRVSTCSFNVIVVDNAPPEIYNCIATDTTVYLTASECEKEVLFNNITTYDPCGPTTNTWQGVPANNLFPLDTTEVTYIVVGGNQDSSTCTFDVIIIDTLSPTFDNCFSDTTIYANMGECSQVFNTPDLGVNEYCGLSGGALMQIDTSGYESGDEFPVGSVLLVYQATDLSNNVATCSLTVEVQEVPDQTAFNVTTPVGLCLNGDTIIQLDECLNLNSNHGGDFYVNGTLTSADYQPSAQGTEDVITYIYGTGACIDTIEHVIALHQLTANAGEEDSICGLSYELAAIPGGNTQTNYWMGESAVSFSNNQHNANVTVSEGGVYYFYWVAQQDQCVVSDSVQIIFYQQPTADAGENQVVEINEVDLDARLDYGVGTWIVDESEGMIEDSTLYNSHVDDLNLGLNTFIWVVTNGVCPSDSATVRIFYDMLTIPNAFTPNGDGVNDEFRIKGFELYSDAKITIMDRWGEVLFITDESNEAWNGTYEGKDVVEDTYFYILYINEKEYTGYIELRR
ncbi:MAG: gliding motility-associated C-terminal domain-containing protein [Flavobacteriales bacterium]|jgi:gliding motility-associated-like protein|nr:gliding motility-associated C-terminal domain-containing protein [Flavobacteriales bacterium]